MNKTINVHFRLKKRSSYVIGENLPIYLRLTIDGERTEFSTQREIDPAKWNSKKGRAIATKKEETRQLNSFLETMQSQIYEAQRALLNKGKEITVRSIRNKMLGIEEEVIDPLKDKSLMPVYREHIKQISDLVGKEYAKGTLKRFKSAFVSLEAFMKHKKKEDIKLRELNYQFITVKAILKFVTIKDRINRLNLRKYEEDKIHGEPDHWHTQGAGTGQEGIGFMPRAWDQPNYVLSMEE